MDGQLQRCQGAWLCLSTVHSAEPQKGQGRAEPLLIENRCAHRVYLRLRLEASWDMFTASAALQLRVSQRLRCTPPRTEYTSLTVWSREGRLKKGAHRQLYHTPPPRPCQAIICAGLIPQHPISAYRARPDAGGGSDMIYQPYFFRHFIEELRKCRFPYRMRPK